MAKVTCPSLTPEQIAAIEADPWLALHPDFPQRYIVYVSGRGTGKSYKISDTILWYVNEYPSIRVLVAREKADSNSESVKEEIAQHIKRRNFSGLCREVRGSIVHVNNSKIIFKGLNEAAGSHKAAKSTAQIDIAWIEEAQEVGEAAWTIFLPTIRKEGSKVIISANPEHEDGYLATRWIENPDKDTILIRLYKEDNPYFPSSLKAEMEHDQKMIDTAPHQDARIAAQALYDWKWNGDYKRVTDKQVLKRCIVKDFETPRDVTFYHGMDHGFASDPASIVRCFILKNPEGLMDLYVDYAGYGHGVPVHDLGKFIAACPTVTRYNQSVGHIPQWTVYADNSRPELNNMLDCEGYEVKPCDKWEGSIEDGVTFLNSFDRIYIKPELTELIAETKLYSYKVDRITGKALPLIADKHNHGIDALRYALQDLIKQVKAGFFDLPAQPEKPDDFGSGVGFY